MDSYQADGDTEQVKQMLTSFFEGIRDYVQGLSNLEDATAAARWVQYFSTSLTVTVESRRQSLEMSTSRGTPEASTTHKTLIPPAPVMSSQSNLPLPSHTDTVAEDPALLSVRRSTKRRASVLDSLSPSPSSTDNEESDSPSGSRAVKESLEYRKLARRRVSSGQQSARGNDLAISNEFGVEDAKRSKIAFLNGLMTTEDSHPQFDESAADTGIFSQDLARDVVDLIYEKIMSKHGLLTLNILVNQYNKGYSTDGDAGLKTRAESLARNEDLDPTIRRFFGAYSQVLTRPTKLEDFYRIIEGRKLKHEYLRLKNLAVKQEPSLIKAMKDGGFNTKKGYGWASVVIDFLSEMLQTDRRTLIATCDYTNGIDTLTQHFDDGVLAVLPPGACRQLNRIGAPRVKKLCSLIDKHIKPFRPISRLLKVNIVDAIMRGDEMLPCNFDELRDYNALTYVGAIEKAISEHQSSCLMGYSEGG